MSIHFLMTYFCFRRFYGLFWIIQLSYYLKLEELYEVSREKNTQNRNDFKQIEWNKTKQKLSLTFSFKKKPSLWSIIVFESMNQNAVNIIAQNTRFYLKKQKNELRKMKKKIISMAMPVTWKAFYMKIHGIFQ